MNRKYDSGVCFLVQVYIEDKEERRNTLGSLLLSGNQEIVWADHTEDEAKPHTIILVRMPYSMTISAFASRFGIKERFVQLCGKDKEHKDYKAAMRYLLHRTKASIAEGKYQYPLESLKGPWREHAKKVIGKEEKVKWKDSDITLILDHIDKCEYVSTADLIRWACSHDLYSILRRSLSAIRDCLREHNSIYLKSDPLVSAQEEIRKLREKQSLLEKKIAYADGYIRKDRKVQTQPWRVNVELLQEMLQQGRINDD